MLFFVNLEGPTREQGEGMIELDSDQERMLSTVREIVDREVRPRAAEEFLSIHE